MKLNTRPAGGFLDIDFTGIYTWFGNIRQFASEWWGGFWRELVKMGTTGWGLIVVVSGLLYAVATHIVPLFMVLVSTLTATVTGTFDLVPPPIIATVLAIANTFCPLDEFCGRLVTYGTLIGSLALYRWIKTLIPAEAGV